MLFTSWFQQQRPITLLAVSTLLKYNFHITTRDERTQSVEFLTHVKIHADSDMVNNGGIKQRTITDKNKFKYTDLDGGLCENGKRKGTDHISILNQSPQGTCILGSVNVGVKTEQICCLPLKEAEYDPLHRFFSKDIE